MPRFEKITTGVLKSRDTTCMVRCRSGGRSFDIMAMPFIPYVSNFSLS
jgi:hypothetical protein